MNHKKAMALAEKGAALMNASLGHVQGRTMTGPEFHVAACTARLMSAYLSQDPKNLHVTPPLLDFGSPQHKEFTEGLVTPFKTLDEAAKVFAGQMAFNAIATADMIKQIAPNYSKANGAVFGSFEQLGQAAALESYEYMVRSCAWAFSAYPVFELTDDFFHAIAVTDFGDAGDQEIKLPFDSFVLNLPKTNLIKANRLLAAEVYVPEGNANIRFNTRIYKLHINRRDLLHFQWPAGTKMSELLRDDDVAHDQRLSNGSESFVIASGNLDDKEEAEMALARRVLANTLTYINTSGGLPTEKHRGQGVFAVERTHDQRPLFRVGRPLKLPHPMREALRAGVTGANWKLARKHIVRGHWRNQPFGPNRSERRLQWIAPYWKGPETLNEAFERTYSVQ